MLPSVTNDDSFRGRLILDGLRNLSVLVPLCAHNLCSSVTASTAPDIPDYALARV